MPVNEDCRHYVMQSTPGGEKLERCKVGANQPLPFSLPRGLRLLRAPPGVLGRLAGPKGRGAARGSRLNVAPGPGDGPDRLPVLGAGRFSLRGFEPGDLDLVRQAATDPFIPLISTVPRPFSEAGGRRFIDQHRHRLRDGFGYSFVIVEGEAAAGSPVGSIGLWLRDLDQGRASVGYWVLGPARRRGAATAALGALAAWAFDRLGVPRLELYAEPWNEPSIKVAAANGFVAEGVLRAWQVVGDGRRDMVMLARLAGDPPGPAGPGGES